MKWAQARAQGLVQDRLRLKDATHIVANIAVPTTLQLVAQVRSRLLQALRPYALTRVQEEEAEVEALRRVTSDLKDEERLPRRSIVHDAVPQRPRHGVGFPLSARAVCGVCAADGVFAAAA